MTDLFERLKYITSGEPEWRIPRLQRAVAYALGLLCWKDGLVEFIEKHLHSVADLKGELVCTWNCCPPIEIEQAFRRAWLGPCGDGTDNVTHDVL